MSWDQINIWTMPFGTREVYESWSSWKADKAIKKIWVVVPACIFRCIWSLEKKKWKML